MIDLLFLIVSKLIRRIESHIAKQHLHSCGSNCRFFHTRIIGGNRINIGNNFLIQENSIISTWNKYQGLEVNYETILKIGDNCSFGTNTHITCVNKIIIGSGVLVGKNVTITDNSHGSNHFYELEIPPVKRELFSKGPVIIEDNVWLGDKVTILPNVRIGRGAIVGANSVVTKDIPPYTVNAGNPCKILKYIK